MKLCVMGSTFAPTIFRKVWGAMGFVLQRKPEDADLVFISWDTAIGKDGKREEESIRAKVQDIYPRCHGPVILTSQVTPGFTRSLNLPIYPMAETLRIKDVDKRARNPDYIVLGCPNPHTTLPVPIQQFVMKFEGVEVIRCFYEEAEFSKIAVNMTLASQVDNANRLSDAAKAVGAQWYRIAEILKHDKRIGPESYLMPGRWQDSQHLLRDYVTLKEIENEH